MSCSAAAAAAAVAWWPSTLRGGGCAISWTGTASARRRASRHPRGPLLSTRPPDRQSALTIGAAPLGASALPRRLPAPQRPRTAVTSLPHAALPARPLDPPQFGPAGGFPAPIRPAPPRGPEVQVGARPVKVAP